MATSDSNIAEPAPAAIPPRRHRHRRRRRSVIEKLLKQVLLVSIYAAAIALVLYLWEFITK